jgi:ATP-dependent Clp protease ATP-binding subunit ClpC
VGLLDKPSQPVQSGADSARPERALEHDYVGAEHLLLALTRGDSTASVAARTLAAISITRDGVLSLLTPGDGGAGNWHLPFTPQAKDVLDAAWHDAGNDQISAEHFLLALAGRSDAAACQVLHAHDALIRQCPSAN